MKQLTEQLCVAPLRCRTHAVLILQQHRWALNQRTLSLELQVASVDCSKAGACIGALCTYTEHNRNSFVFRTDLPVLLPLHVQSYPHYMENHRKA